MLVIILKSILIIALILILIQDVKERQVYWALFPLVGLCGGILYYKNTLHELFYISVLMNIAFVSMLLLVLFLYARLKLKTQLKNTFGLGDILMFLALSFSFSTVSFLVIFIFSLFFSLVLYFVLKKEKKDSHCPSGWIYGSVFLFLLICPFGLEFQDSLYNI